MRQAARRWANRQLLPRAREGRLELQQAAGVAGYNHVCVQRGGPLSGHRDLARASRVASNPQTPRRPACGARACLCPNTGRQYGIFYSHGKACLSVQGLFHFSLPVPRIGIGFRTVSLECCGLVFHAARSGFFFLRHLSHQCFCGKHQSGDRGGVLQRVPGHFRRVDHACFYQVDILAGGNVVTFVP